MNKLMKSVVAMIAILTIATSLTSDKDEFPTPHDVKTFTVDTVGDIWRFAGEVDDFAGDVRRFLEDLATW